MICVARRRDRLKLISINKCVASGRGVVIILNNVLHICPYSQRVQSNYFLVAHSVGWTKKDEVNGTGNSGGLVR